jgi:single-strand DNA-binding protein
MNLNRVIILGRITAAPQLRTTPGGQSVAPVGVATNRAWTDKNGKKQEDVEFHNVVFWGRQAEIASQFLTKGSYVLVEGRLATRGWTDKNGTERRVTEIIAEKVELPPKSFGAPPEAKPVAEKGRGLQEPLPDVPVISIGGDEEDNGRSLERLF